MTTGEEPPPGYVQPTSAWCVEYVDPREPEAGSHQVGAFVTESEARKLLRQLESEEFFTDLRINLVPVHRRFEDWEWDR